MRVPILLAVELSSGSFLSCRLLHPDRHTLPSLKRWYQTLPEAIFLIQLGDLQYLKGKQASALHRDWGENWTDHQPRISPSLNHLEALARSTKINTMLCNRNQQWFELSLKSVNQVDNPGRKG
ncbi:hypothetical protein [Endozoicomonas sp. 8E]|uniref:hypothetical protein n=1 Tax=Endozoicomonas sp. 8E TaxID=3035692 RepID=UPI0029394B96|nr:hypothetical protein [Endozoicomonas sp. 8E]WOG28738.1 hypothetical protein P6910_03520 [Endozoicomonas sp. 8E]